MESLGLASVEGEPPAHEEHLGKEVIVFELLHFFIDLF